MNDDTAMDDKARSVLDAATQVFLEHGFTAATTDMIQKKAGVSKATVYARYPTKEALFSEVISRTCARVAAGVDAVETESGCIRDQLTDLGAGYLHLLLQPSNLALFRVVIAEAQRFPDLARHFYLSGPKTIVSLLTQQLGQAVAREELDLQSVGLSGAAELFLNSLRGSAQLECLLHPLARPSEAQVDHWVEIAVVMFMRAFGVQNCT